MNLIMKEDIRRYDLVNILCKQLIFAPKRFRFLTEWDPFSLLQLDNDGYTPLRRAAGGSKSIEVFRIVLDAGLRYFPNKQGIGLAFRKRKNFIHGNTPFQRACEKHNRTKVMKALEDKLARYASTTPLNVADALIVSARDDNIHQDCVYFLMRRYPDLVVNSLHNTSNIIIDSSSNNNSSNAVIHDDTSYQQDDDEHNYHVDGNNITTNESVGGYGEHHETNDNTTKGRNRKRKREL